MKSAKEAMRARMPSLILFLGVLLLDQATKALTRTMPFATRQEAIPGILWLTHITNTGASFGMLQGNNLLLIFVSLFVLGILIYSYDSFTAKAERFAYALILAGLLGNLIDRLLLGGVTDMLDLGWWPVFNVADSALVVGVATLIAYELFWKRKEAKRAQEQGKKTKRKGAHH